MGVETPVAHVLARISGRLRESEQAGRVALAIVVGLAGGGAAILFHYLIPAAARLLEATVGRAADASGWPLGRLAIPAVGLAAVAAFVHRFASEAKGHGVPEVMYAVRKRGGRIRPRVALVKALASACTIGAGGAVGREGPIVQIGCSVGSTVAQWFRLGESGIRLLVACGAAAGIGATFNAPVAGVLFALEVILADFSARSFGLVVIAAVSATALAQSVMGSEPSYQLRSLFALHSVWELPLYALLGGAMGLLALAYVRAVYLAEALFDGWRWPRVAKAALGGAALGLMGWWGSPLVLGMGHEGVMAAMHGELGLGLLAGLALLKIAATSLTLGAGGSGGVFAPALFIGAMAGGAFGTVVHGWWPVATAPAGAYALVGMAALFGGAAHAPITAILILFEMTNDYRIMLPLLLAVVVSYLIASGVRRDSIYTIKLRRMGGLEAPRPGMSVLDGILVADAMRADSPLATPELPVAELATRMHQAHARSLPVVDGAGRLVGIVTETDVERALFGGATDAPTVERIMTRSLLTCHPDETLSAVLRRFRDRNVRQLPVVARDDPGRLVGVLRREELLWAYGEVAQEHARLQAAAEGPVGASRDDVVLLDVTVEADDARVCWRRVGELGLPSRALIVRLRRGGHDLVPRGATVVEPGDQLTLFTTPSHATELRHWATEAGVRVATAAPAP
jgi:CIC family chloride channel protein